MPTPLDDGRAAATRGGSPPLIRQDGILARFDRSHSFLVPDLGVIILRPPNLVDSFQLAALNLCQAQFRIVDRMTHIRLYILHTSGVGRVATIGRSEQRGESDVERQLVAGRIVRH